MVTEASADLISWVFKGLIGLCLTVWGFFYKRRADGIDNTLEKHDNQLNEINEDVVRLQSETVSEAKVREIVRTEFNAGFTPIVESIGKIEEGMKTQEQCTQHLLIVIAEQKGYNDARKEFDK